MTIASPADGATNVPQDAQIVLTFDEAVKAGAGRIELHDDTTGNMLFAGSADQFPDYISFSGNQAFVDPHVSKFNLGDTYRLVLAPDSIEDLAGNAFAGIVGAGVHFTVTTTDSLPPVLISPALDETNLGSTIDANYRFVFDENVAAGSGAFEIHKVSDGSLVSAIDIQDTSQVNFWSNVITLDPRVNLDPYTGYYITLSNGAVTDISGHAYSGFSSPADFSFTTGDLIPPPAPPFSGGVVDTLVTPGPDTIAPSLMAISPADNAADVPIASDIILTFDEVVKAGAGALEIHKSSDGSLFESIALSDTSQVTFIGLTPGTGSEIVIDPAINMALNTAYYIVLQDGAIQDVSGNAYAGFSSPLAFNFTTSITADTTPPVLVSANDNGYANVPTNLQLGLIFNEPLQAGSGMVQIHNADGSLFDSIDITDASHATVRGNGVGIVPHASLGGSNTYYVTLDSGVIQDLAGNAYVGFSSPNVFRFSTSHTVAESSTLTTAPGDFDADGNSDILWQSTDGSAGLWLMNGLSPFTQSPVGLNPGTAWHIKGDGDFNNDGKADVLWQNNDGSAGIWLMSGLSPVMGSNVGANPGAAWHIKGAGDFNGDGKADILWQNDDGSAGIWLMNGTTVAAATSVGSNPGTAWHIKGNGDFNNDGNADILWQNDNGQAAIWLMNGTSVVSATAVGANPGLSWHVKGAGDFNGDGKADILWQNDSGQAAIWLMNGTTLMSGPAVGGNPGPTWHVEHADDLNGDGKADILWQNDNGQPGVWLMDGLTPLTETAIGGNPGPAWHLDWT